MPLPKPRQGESEDDFIGRCVSSDVVQSDYDDQEQRVAVCYGIWEDSRKMKNDQLLVAVRQRGVKRTPFGGGILTADSWVRTLSDAAGSDACYRYAASGSTSFDDVLRKAAKTLTYSNDDMRVQAKDLLVENPAPTLPEGVALPKNTLMVFRHTLTTPREDRDGDILRTEGAEPDPRMLLLWQHVHTIPIGKMLAVVEHTKDRLTVLSAIVDINELSHDAAVMVDNDMGRFSHGFRALDWAPFVDDKGEPLGGFDIKSFEIMEESLVSVPSNTDAENQEILLSLVEGGKLTSGLMKEVGRTIRGARPVTVRGADVRDEDDQDKSTGTDGNGTATETGDACPKQGGSESVAVSGCEERRYRAG